MLRSALARDIRKLRAVRTEVDFRGEVGRSRPPSQAAVSSPEVVLYGASGRRVYCWFTKKKKKATVSSRRWWREGKKKKKFKKIYKTHAVYTTRRNRYMPPTRLTIRSRRIFNIGVCRVMRCTSGVAGQVHSKYGQWDVDIIFYLQVGILPPTLNEEPEEPFRVLEQWSDYGYNNSFMQKKKKKIINDRF